MVCLEGFEPPTHALGIPGALPILKKINNLAWQNADKSVKIRNPATTKYPVGQSYIPAFRKSITAVTAAPQVVRSNNAHQAPQTPKSTAEMVSVRPKRRVAIGMADVKAFITVNRGTTLLIHRERRS
jgi:hypothetical protein